MQSTEYIIYVLLKTIEIYWQYIAPPPYTYTFFFHFRVCALIFDLFSIFAMLMKWLNIHDAVGSVRNWPSSVTEKIPTALLKNTRISIASLITSRDFKLLPRSCNAEAQKDAHLKMNECCLMILYEKWRTFLQTTHLQVLFYLT